ncbi:hypothetical protein AB4072_07120 [Microvirga sp. 2MCAF38]|uniref:hypothetical protein n=1 Tax=Microvirga sp. 2MCAF38 TaxID=3232989 RepID=UPI003F9E1CFA
MNPSWSQKKRHPSRRLYRLERATETRLTGVLALLIGFALMSILAGTEAQSRRHYAETPSYIHIEDQ